MSSSSPAQDMLSPEYPMISPKPFSKHTPESWLSYVKSLHQAPEKKQPKEEIVFKRTKTGKIQISVKRDPKIILESEVFALAEKNGATKAEVWNYLVAKKVTILREKK